MSMDLCSLREQSLRRKSFQPRQSTRFTDDSRDLPESVTAAQILYARFRLFQSQFAVRLFSGSTAVALFLEGPLAGAPSNDRFVGPNLSSFVPQRVRELQREASLSGISPPLLSVSLGAVPCRCLVF
jgi:hypothetical protein